MTNKKTILQIVFIFLLSRLLVFFIIPRIVKTVLLYGNSSFVNVDILVSMLGQSFGVFVPALLILLFIKRNEGQLPHSYTRNIWTFVRDIIACVLLFYSLRIISDGLGYVYIGLTNDFSKVSFNGSMDTQSMLINIFTLAIIPAVFEELFFRYAIYYSLASKMNKLFVIIFSSTLFAIAHSVTIQIIYAFILGIILMCVFYKSKSYVLIVLMHTIYNSLVIIHDYYFYLPSDNILVSFKYASQSACLSGGLRWIAIGLLIFCIPVVLIFLDFSQFSRFKITNRRIRAT